MVDEKAGFFGSSKREKRESKVMVEPEAKVMEEVIPEEEAEEVTSPSFKVKKPAVVKAAAPSQAKTMLDSHPVAKQKHKSIVNQKAAGAGKYFRSK